jgi:hypothetical protein
MLGGMTFSSFSGLQNTVKMNEYVLTLEQDIRSVQRAAMLLERNSGEKWIYGLGIDFGNVGSTDGKYTVFKWCSPFDDYGNIATRSALLAYDPNSDLGTPLGYGADKNGYINISGGILDSNNCDLSAYSSTLHILSGYSQSLTTPKSTISIAPINDNVYARYVIFESVSGRAFFYDKDGVLLNFDSTGKMVETPEPFVITIKPYSNGNTRIISIGNLSGKVTMQSTK